MITDDDAARRLARAILKDATLYGGAAAVDDPAAMAEGRELFGSRVSGSLHHVFEEERRAHGGRDGLSAPRPGVDARPAGVVVTDGAGGGPLIFAVIGALLVLGIAGAAFLLAR